MSTSLVVREARHDEVDDIARLLRNVFEAYRPRGPVVDPAYHRAFEQYLQEATNVRARLDDALVFVALDDERIVGTGTLYPRGASQSYARAVQGKPWPDEWASLRLLAVEATHRGRGVGRRLLDARVSRARELGASCVALHTSEEFAGARRLIRRLGWQRRPAYDHYPAPGVHAEAYVLEWG